MWVCSSSLIAQQKVYIAYIEGDIDLGLAPYINRVIANAEEDEAAAIIFKINTFGGRVDAATQIKDAIIGTDRFTIAFINNRAISAGALISISCNKIIMVKGSSIGAATVVDQTGEKVGEKYQSYMRSEMRSTAEKNGRRTDIAEGMVDEGIIIPGLVDSTQLITLTSLEAYKYGIADTILNNIDEVVNIIKKSKDTEEAKNKLMSRFEISEIQVKAILNMPLSRLTNLEQQKLIDEEKELNKKIKEYERILKNRQERLDIIKTELVELSKKYGDERRTKIVEDFTDFKSIEKKDFVKKEPTIVILTKNHYIKRMSVAEYRTQRRGGRGKKGK